MKKFTSLVLALALSLGLSAPALAASPSFSDVPADHWAYDYVEAAASRGWISGNGNGIYSPDRSVTYAEFCTMLARAFYAEEAEAVTTTTGHWWESYWSVLNDRYIIMRIVVNPSVIYKDEMDEETVAAMGQPIDRNNMALMIYNLLRDKDVERPTFTDNDASDIIPDWDEIPYQFQIPARTCYALKILSGGGGGRFNGTSPMTRAQAATVLCNLHRAITGEDLGGGQTGGPEAPEQPTSPGKDANGYTLASGVRTSIGKSNSYKTKGYTDTANANGYFTNADVDLGDAQLVYELLDLVNEARRAEGLNALQWATSDAMEEYTLLRAVEIVDKFEHVRPDKKFAYTEEVIYMHTAGGSPQSAFNGWMNSPGHRATLMRETIDRMCAARCGNYWIITVSADNTEAMNRAANSNYIAHPWM